MKNLREFDRYRVPHPFAGMGDETCGMFRFHGNPPAVVIASTGGGWEHVSISFPNRTPTWEEMCHFKAMFFNDDECVVQYHPPSSVYVNRATHCLHLWKPVGADFPMPPKEFV